MSRFEKSGAISVDAAPPPPPAPDAVLSVSWLISSKLAMLLLASFAAAPTPSNAFCSSFSPCAADFCEDQLFPESIPKNFAIAVTTCVRIFTSFTKTGITTCKIGWASVKNAALSRATAARASSFCMMVFPSHVLRLCSARVIRENTRTRLKRPETRLLNVFMLSETFFAAVSIRSVAPLAFVICSVSSPAFCFAASKAEVCSITLSVIFAYFPSKLSTILSCSFKIASCSLICAATSVCRPYAVI